MSLDGNIQLINQICAKSGLKGKDLENLRTNLSNLSKQELQAELLKFLVSSDTNNSNKGLQVEQASSDVLLENYQKTYYYDKKGNIITEYKDGDNVLERIIQGKDDAGNDIEITVTYRNNRPFTKVVKKNGEKEETVSYTYHDKSDTNFIPSVTVETRKSDNSSVKFDVLAVSEYDGNFDLSGVIERETTYSDGRVTTLTKILNILVETAKRPDGTTLTTYYNGTDITACDNNQLHKLRQLIKRQGQEPQELYFDGEGNTIVTVNAGDGWERLARRFHTTEKKLKELNPKIKNLKAGQDILIPKEFDIESKEIGRVQPRDEAIVQAWNAEVDRQIAQKVTENISKEDANELKKAGVNPSAENYIFYQKYSELNPSVKQNVLSMIKYYKAQGIKDLNAIKAKILETYPDVNLFDSGKLIKFFKDLNTGIPYFNRYNKQSGQPVSVETFVTDYLKLNLKTEPGKTVYERLASISQENLDKLNASQLSDMSKLNFEAIAAKFLNAGLNIMTKSEYQVAMNQIKHSAPVESETQIKDKTVYFAYKMVHQAKETLEAHLAELKDHYVKNFGEIVWEGLKVIPSILLPKGVTSGSGQYEAIVKNIHHKISELDKLEGDLLVLRGKVNSSDFEAQYKKLLKTDYNPEKIQTLMTLSQNQPDKNSPEYAVYEKQMESAIKDVTGKDFTQNVSSFINWSRGAGSLVETAIFCYVTAGMGSVVTVGGKTARAVTVMGKTFTTATRSGAAMVMATNFGRYAAVRAGLNFIDDIDNLCAPMTLEEMLRGRKDITLGGMFVGENNADQIRESLAAVKNWATGKITRDEADAIIKKNFKSLSFDDFVSSNGGQWVLNTATSSIFGLAAGYASPWFRKAGEIGTKWGQRLGLNTPNIQQVTADLLAKNPAGINAAEFMAKTYEALHATNIAGKGLQFLVETAVFYCTNLPLSLIQETLSESNGELEKAFNEGRLGSYLISRFGEEALNLLKVKSIGTIIAMMMGTTNIAQLKENFEDYDVLKNTTIRYEDATIQQPDGTFTSGKTVVLDGPTGKLYVDGSSAKFYTAQGQLVVNENIGAQTQFTEMNEGVKTAFLLGKFMQIERYVRTLQNPVEDAVDLSMPYKPSSQEQQVQIAIDQIAGQNSQQPITAPQTVINPAVNQPVENETGAAAVEIPINRPLKNPYEKPEMTVIDMAPQQMVAASSPQQITSQQVSRIIPAAPLTDEQKTELHESLQKIVQAYSDNNYAGIDILSNLTEDERKEFVDNILHLGSGKIHDDYDFLFFVNGEKPVVLLGGLSETPEPYLDKLKSDNIDVFHRVVTLGNGQKRNNTFLINKQMVKKIIGENKELFQKRLGLSENTTVNEIYEKLLSNDSIIKDHEESSDLTGLILGYPKYNTMIFRLDKWIEDNNIMTKVEMRRNPDIEKYKSALKQALLADDSPYKNMSDEFKNTLFAKINEIKEVTPSRVLFNNDSDGYVFNYTTPEPEELVRIEQSMSQTADNITAKNKYLTMSYSKVAEAINDRLQSPQNISDLMDLFNALKEKSPRNVRKIKEGSASFYDPETKKNYNLIYDRFGNIIKYTVTVGWNESDYYIYDKNGKLTKVNETDYYKVKTDFARDDELLDYILTHPELLPAETRRLILQDEYHTFSREDIDELSSLMKTQDDIAIVNKLLSTKGNESKYIRAIGDALKLSAQKFGVKDIIKVLKSDKAKAYVLNHIKTDSYAKKTELEPLLDNQKFEKIVTYDFNDEVDLSYRTKDINLDVICTDLPAEYLSNSAIKEQIDSQVPIGEAACINGEMYCRTEDGLVPIKLSKETFDKLFPVDQRYNIKQGRIGDCWFIAELGGYMATPNGRATLYSLFREDGNDIYIKLPSNPNIEIKFENGDLNKLFPISLYKHNKGWKLGKGDAHVQACKGLQMIEQALSFIRDNYTKEETIITANDKFLMNKQMQRLDGSHIGGGGGTRYLGNDEVIGYYTSIGIVLNGANSVEEILDILADGVAKSDNVFGSVSFHDDVSIDVNEEIVSGHQYRIVGYDKETGIVKMVDPTVANKYMDIPIEYFKKARPNITLYKIGSGIKENSEVTSVSDVIEHNPIDNKVEEEISAPKKVVETVEIPQTENSTIHNSYVQVIMQPMREIVNKFGFDFDIEKLEQTVNSLSLEALKNIADKRSGDEVEWNDLTKEKISEIQEILKENGFNDDIHLLMFLYANGDTEVKIKRLKDRKGVLTVGTSQSDIAQWIKIMNMYDGEYNFYLHNNNPEEPVPQEKTDWESFKADKTKVTQVLLSQVEDKAAFEKFKVSKNYETDEDAVIPFIKQLRRNDESFKLSESAKEIINDFVKKYDISGFMPDAQFDLDYLNNYNRTSHIYNSKHEMEYHDLTQRIFDIRRKFDLDKDENFDLEKLHDKLEDLPTETLSDLRRMFNEYEIKSKEDALRILNSDFSKMDIEAVKSMLEDNDCFSYFALADFVFAKPEEFAIKHQRLVTRKEDLPSNCDYDSQKKAWTEIINMSDEDYNYYHSMQEDYPEGLDIKELPIYRKLMAEAPEFTTQLMGMKKKAHIFFGNDVPRFTMEEISKLYEISKIDKELTLALINKTKDKLATEYVYNYADDIIKIVELTKTYGREEVKKLLECENSYSPDQIETLLSLKAENPELYEIFVKNGYSAGWLNELKGCIARNPALTNELMQNKEYSISDIKSLVDCDEEHPEITKYLFEKTEQNGRTEDRFTKNDKTRYANYVLQCNEEQLEFFMECLEARKPNGEYRFSYSIKDICKLHDEHPQELKEMLDYKFKDEFSDEEECLYEGVITVFMPCYLEDKEAALEAINANPGMSVYSMKDLYDMLRSPDKNDVYELLNIKKAGDENSRRFIIDDIKNLLPLKKQDPAEFEKLLNTRALQNGKVVDAYDADFIKTYMGTPYGVVKHLMNLTVQGEDGNEYKMLTGRQITKIHEIYADSASDKALLDEIIYIPKYKAILQILTKETAPVFCNRKVLDLLDKNGIENATSVVLSPIIEGKFMLLIKFDKTAKTINMSIDDDKNVTVIPGGEISYKRDDKNIIRRNFEDGSYLVEEISYVDVLDGDGGKMKLAYSKMKTWYDSEGVQTRSEVVTPVEGAPGEFTINVYERGLNQQMVKKTIGSVKITEDDEGQTSKIEKTLTSPDGTVTRQTKLIEPDGTSTTYEISAVENGEKKVLFSQSRSHVKLDENHYTSSLDGQIYDMKFGDDGVTVSKLDDDGKPFETITLGTDVLDPQLMGLFKQLPGDTFFLIHKIGLKGVYLDEHVKNNAHYSFDKNTIEISGELMNDPFVFMHELHHGVSHNMFGGAADNKAFSDTYNLDLDNYQKNSANQEEHIAGYFSSKYHGTTQGKEETFAEIGAIISGVDVSAAANEILGMRSLIVQQNMARTIATEADMIKEGMTKPLPPRKEVPGVTMARISDAPEVPAGLTQISLNLTPKQVDIYNLLQRDLKNFGDFDDALQIKIVKVLDKYNSKSNKQLLDLFKGILAYADQNMIEKICNNDYLLSEINKNALSVAKVFAHHKNIDKEIRNKVYFNLLLMRYFYPGNYSNLTRSKGYQQIMTGGLNVGVLQNLKYNDNIDEDYFYNLFDNLEKGADNTVAQSDVLKQYPENHIKTATELDPSRQDEILNLIKTAPDQTLMAQVLNAVNTANANINENVDKAKKIGNYINPAEVTRERNLLIELIKMTSENSDIVGTISKLGLSSRESSVLSTRILKAKFDEKTQDELLTLLSEYAVVFNIQYALNVVDLVQKAPEKIDLVRKIIAKGDTYWLSFISENNADYIEDKMDNTEFGSITFMQTLMLTLAKDMPEMKDKNNWQHIEDCANILLEDIMNEYISGYDKISDEFKEKVAAEPEHKGRFIYRKNVAVNKLRTFIREKIKFMSGVLDMYVNSPEKYQQVKNSGFLDMVKQGKLHPAALIMLNRNSNLSDNLYSDLEAVKSGKSIVPEFPGGTPLEKVFRETKTGDAVEVGSKMYINDGKQLVEWQMTKDAFLKLFPPVERFTTLQGNLGDCYLVSSITSMMNTPEGRAELYKSFKLDGNNVVVTIKGYEDFKGITTFPNGNITVDKAQKHVIGCPGIIMFEQAYAKVSLREPYFDFLPSLDETTTPFSLMQRVQSGYSNEAMSELLGLKNIGKLSIEAPYIAPKKSVVQLNIINTELSADKVKAYLSYYAGRKNFILQFGTLPKDKEAVESSILPEYNLVSSHGYNIVGYDSNTEIVKITNPHNASVVTEIPFSKLMKYMQALIVTNLNE